MKSTQLLKLLKSLAERTAFYVGSTGERQRGLTLQVENWRWSPNKTSEPGRNQRRVTGRAVEQKEKDSLFLFDGEARSQYK